MIEMVLVLALVNAGVLVVIERLGRGRDASCGACGVATAGLETLTCRACGADLRDAGILTRRMTRMAPAWLLGVLAATILTTVVPAGVIMTVGLLDRLNPVLATTTTTILTSDGQPSPLEVLTTLTANPDGSVDASMELTSSAVPGDSTLPVAIATGAVGTTMESVDEWLRSNIDDPAWPGDRITALAAQLHGNLDGYAGGRMGYGSGPLSSVAVSTHATTERGRPWLAMVYVAFWGSVWGLGVITIVLWARRRGRRAWGTT